jgi:lipopolysaccharide export system permease protein
MMLLDRYLVREFTRWFGLILSVFVLLYLLVDFFGRLRMFLSNSALPSQMAAYFLYNLPMIISLTLPAAVLVATLLTLGTLSRHSEIIAMKACGISLYRIFLPIVLCAGLLSIFNFLNGEFLVPEANQRAEHIKRVEIQKKEPRGTFKRNELWYRGEKGIYNFKVFDVETRTLHGITINHLDARFHLTSRIDAEWAEWKEGRWLFHNVMIARFADGEFPELTWAEHQAVDLPESPSDFQVVQKDADQMGYFELSAYVRKLRAEGYDVTRYAADLHGKLAFSFVSLILVLIGVSFSVISERGGGAARSIAAGIVLGFSYWLLHAFALSLGRSGTLPPLLAAWTANLVFFVLAVFLVRRVQT